MMPIMSNVLKGKISVLLEVSQYILTCAQSVPEVAF